MLDAAAVAAASNSNSGPGACMKKRETKLVLAYRKDGDGDTRYTGYTKPLAGNGAGVVVATTTPAPHPNTCQPHLLPASLRWHMIIK